MRVVFSDESGRLTPDMRSLMERAAELAFSLEFGEETAAAGFDIASIDAETGVTVVSDEEIRELNREYRDRDRVTDVLSFPQFADREELLGELLEAASDGISAGESGDSSSELYSGMPAVLTGDVVLCYDQALRQSAEFGTGLTREMLYLFVHSMMHLFGYDHEGAEEKKIMRAREEAVLSAMGISGNNEAAEK